jgi:hypothetical protein
MPSEYEKAHETYRALVKAAQSGNAQAFKDKAKAMNEIRGIEREAARAGTVLNATYSGDKVKVDTTDVPSKRSLQEEYVRKFDPQVTVEIGGKEQTLQQYHSKRLLGK